jgi:hypothetical protein
MAIRQMTMRRNMGRTLRRYPTNLMRALVGIKQDPVHIPALTAAVPAITTTVIARACRLR